MRERSRPRHCKRRGVRPWACLHFEPPSQFCLSPNVVNRHAMPKTKAVTFFVIALAYWRCAYDFRMQNRNSESSKPGFLSFLHAIYEIDLLRLYFCLFDSLQCVSPLSPITRGFEPNRSPKPRETTHSKHGLSVEQQACCSLTGTCFNHPKSLESKPSATLSRKGVEQPRFKAFLTFLVGFVYQRSLSLNLMFLYLCG